MAEFIRVEYEALEQAVHQLQDRQEVAINSKYKMYDVNDQVQTTWIGASANSYFNWWSNVMEPSINQYIEELGEQATLFEKTSRMVRLNDQNCASLILRLQNTLTSG